MNYNNFACEVLGGDSLVELRGTAWWGVTLSLIQIYRNDYHKEKENLEQGEKNIFNLFQKSAF